MRRVNLRLEKANSSSSCWGVGLVAMDVILAESNQFVALGGSCGNVMALLSWMGWISMPIARLGQDAPGEFLRDEFEDMGAKTDFLTCEKSVKTPIVIQRFTRNALGERVHRFSFTCPECGGWLPRHRPITLKHADLVLEQESNPRAFFFDRVSPAAIKLAEEARSRGALVVFEPASVGDEHRFQQAVDLCHVLKYAKDRLSHLPDMGTAKAPAIVIETMGEQGLRMRWKSKWTRFSAFEAPNFVDAAGSGDWCTAGLIHAIGQGGAAGLSGLSKTRLENGVQLGQALAAINCCYEGARGAALELTHADVNRALAAISGGEEIPSDLASENPSSSSPAVDSICAMCNTFSTSTEADKSEKIFQRKTS